MLQRLLIILTIPAVFACAHKVNDEDRESWRGAPLIDLETHPFFSGLPLEKRSLSNGDELWIYSNMEKTLNASCNVGNCEGSESSRGCLNQFIVGGGVVKEYRPVPRNIFFCVFSCKLRPASRPCD